MKSDIDAVLCVVAHRLPEAGVPCIMIGGHAVNHYGHEECFEALKKHIQELSDAEVSGH